MDVILPYGVLTKGMTMSEQTTNKLMQTENINENKIASKFTVFIRGSSIKIVSTGLYQKDFEVWRRNYDRSPDVTTLLLEYQARFPKATEIFINVLSHDVDLFKKPLAQSVRRGK